MSGVVVRSANGTFVPVPIVGPQGARGPAGPQGPQGPQGHQGLAGADAQGPMGNRGAPDGIRILTGKVSITPVVNTPTSATVYFSPAFSGDPTHFASAQTTVPGTVRACGVGTNPGRSSGTVYVYRTNTTDTTVNWIAMGVW